MKKIEFYFDFLSPYSYLAWTKIREKLAIENDLWSIEFFPISLPKIISHYETKGPGQIKPKRDYLTRDLLRYTTLNHIPFQFPPTLPFNSLYALRLVLAAPFIEQKIKLIDLFFRGAWERGIDIGQSESIESMMRENQYSEVEVNELMNIISTKEIKMLLRKNIDRALSKGVFGVPTFIVRDEKSGLNEDNENMSEELFWGNDSITYLEMYLKGSDPLKRDVYQEFLNKYPMV